MTILLICDDEGRLRERKEALHRAEFTLISAKSVADGWAKSDYFDIAAVVIDHELAHDITAAAFTQRYVTWKLDADATPETLVVELTQVLRRGSELVQ